MEITTEQKRKLSKLKEKADILQKALSLLSDEAEFITKEFDGLTFDYIYNDFCTLEELLEKLEVEVIEKLG